MEESAITRKHTGLAGGREFARGNDVGHGEGVMAQAILPGGLGGIDLGQRIGSRPTAISMARDHSRISAERETMVIRVSGGGLVWPSSAARTERKRRAMQGTPRGSCRRIFAARVGRATTRARPDWPRSEE